LRDAKPLASFQYAPGRLDDVLLFLKRTRDELSELRMVRVWTDRVVVYDVNHDAFEILGLGYQDSDIIPALDSVNAVYKNDSIHDAAPGPYKEFKTGRRYPWARDRVM
jgi:hypothetical protein